jgi:hypothetical protein
MSRSKFVHLVPVLLTSVGLPAVSAVAAESSTPHLPKLVVATASTAIMSSNPTGKPVRVAVPRRGLPLDIKDSGGGATVAVQIHGGIEITGSVARESLGVLICEPGPVGDSYYVGRGNLLTLRSAATDGPLEVAGDVVVPKKTSATVWNEKYHRVSFHAAIEESRLCAAPLPKHTGVDQDPSLAHVVGEIAENSFPKGTAFIEVKKGAPLALLDRPSGTPLHERSAEPVGYTVARIAHEGKWDRVAAGEGPYLLGWIPARPVRKKPAPNLEPDIVWAENNAPASLNTEALKRLPLHEVPAGTELRQFGQVTARLTRPGYARVSAVRDAWQYAVVAVDDDVVAEGWLDPSRVGPRAKIDAKPGAKTDAKPASDAKPETD